MKIITKVVFALLFVLLLPVTGFCDNGSRETAPAQSIPELQRQLETILKDTHTPGMSVAIAHRDGAEWVAGLGTADVASGRSVTAGTLFRIGSVSKGFVSLSILKLVDEGKLSLLDPVRSWAPEIWFDNPWEATDPVRVVDLLEHTTGWDDAHLRETAKDAPNIDLRTALDYDHHSRTSRWPPGTRMAYCNSGPTVAAYIVEKVTGQRFEDYVTQNFFRPIGMTAATYFEPTSGELTDLYYRDGRTPRRYENIILRPSGAINASANDMASYLRFYLNRGAVNGVQIMPATDIDRMEIPTRTWAAQEGLKVGYGLGNYASVAGGFVYHGHVGSIESDLTELAYLPDAGVGYYFSINAAGGGAYPNIEKAIRAYITRGLTKPPLPPVTPLAASARTYTGWYQPDSPRLEMTRSQERLWGLTYLYFQDGQMRARALLGGKPLWVPVTSNQFRLLRAKGPPNPVPTVELISPKAEGRFVQVNVGWTTLRQIPAWIAIGEIILMVWFALAVAAVILYAPFWLIGGISQRRRRPAERSMRLWPLIAVLSLIVADALPALAGERGLARLGNLTAWSGGIFVATLIYAGTSVASAVALWRARKEPIRSGVRRFSVAVVAILLVVTAYMAYWGLIGLRMWA
jgi:CubicO group peptidase (beta-lactamase class C family)